MGLDISRGMLRRVLHRANSFANGPRCTLIHAPAADLTPHLLEAVAQVSCVDAVLCTYGFTAMRAPETAFAASWHVLRPGGTYLVLDVHAAPRTLHARAVGAGHELPI